MAGPLDRSCASCGLPSQLPPVEVLRRSLEPSWYAYVSHKFATVLTVIDMDTLEIAGELAMPGPGGNGIHAIPNVWR